MILPSTATVTERPGMPRSSHSFANRARVLDRCGTRLIRCRDYGCCRLRKGMRGNGRCAGEDQQGADKESPRETIPRKRPFSLHTKSHEMKKTRGYRAISSAASEAPG